MRSALSPSPSRPRLQSESVASTTVPGLLAALGSAASGDPVDWLMGEHWAELDLGRSSRLSLLRRAERDLRDLDGRGGRAGGGRAARPRPSTAYLRRRPEAMVKLVRSGGTATLRGLRDQMSYLSKGGTVELEASERYFGAVLDDDLLAETISAWNGSASTNAKADRTSHFVVSFPIGTDEVSAYRAGRAWAEAMFDRGTYGDVYDYVTAFHTDTPHPHMHVVVSRRGLEYGSWLKVSRRGPIDYDELRFVQVEVATQEGIELEATPRFARARYNRPVADERQRIAIRTGVEVALREWNPFGVARKAAESLVHARTVQADADIVRDTDRALADALDAVAAGLRAGGGGEGDPKREVAPRSGLAPEHIERAEEIVMSKRDELVRNIDRVDEELATIPDGAARAPLEREASKLKARAADLLPGREELRDWRATADGETYRGLPPGRPDGEGDREREIRDRADQKAERIATEAGLDGKAVAERYASDTVPSRALANRWRRDEIEMFKRSRPIGFVDNPERLEEAATDAYTSVHRRIASQFTAARSELAELARKREAIRQAARHREYQRAGEGIARDDAAFARTVRDVLSAREVERLERDDGSALASIASDDGERGRIARRFLDHEARRSEGQRREQLREATERLDRADEPERQRQREEREGQIRERTRGRNRSDRGLDL